SVATTAISTVPSAGTTATIDGTVSAGGHVHVWAKDNLSVISVAGAAAAGAVGVGAAINILNVNSSTYAGVGPSAIVSSGSGDVNVFAGMDEHSTDVAFSGTAGFVSVGAQVAVLNDTGTQTAHVDGGAQVPAGGGLNVGVSAARDVNAYAIGVGLGAFAVGAAVGVVNVSGDASATIGDVHVGGTSAIGGLGVSASDHVTSDLLVIQVEGGVGAGNGAAVAIDNLGGTAKATSGAYGSVGAGGLSVTSDATHNSTIKTLNVTTGVVAVGVTVAVVKNSRSTEAGLTGTAAITFTAPGPVKIQATSSNSADAEVPGGGAGGIQMAVLLGFATLSGHTTTDVEGSVSNASSILVSSIADNTATANTLVAGVSVIGLNGGLASATITSDAKIQTTIGSPASLSGSGAITVEAKTRNAGNLATANTTGGGFGGLVSVGLMAALAYDAAPVRVQLGGHLTTTSSATTPGAAAIGVYAKSTNFTDAEITFLSGSLGFAGNGSVTDSEIQPSAKTEILAGSTSSLSGTNGLVELTATSNNHAKTHSALASGGVLGAISVSIPTSIVAGATGVTEDGSVTHSAALTISASSTNFAESDDAAISIGGIVGVAVVAADSEVTRDAKTDTLIGPSSGSSASLTSSGAINVLAFSSNTASSAALSLAGSLGIAVAAEYEKTRIAGETKADSEGTLTGDSVAIQALAWNRTSPSVNVMAVALAGAGSGAYVDAVITSDALIQASAGGGSIAANGLVKVD
ncbi:MAG TPA: hypothetical protein VKI23_01895, partial [Cellulomonadaceae bacterium]|nr:hypothetical protein [Cellulomonadaceae bacterium]